MSQEKVDLQAVFRCVLSRQVRYEVTALTLPLLPTLNRTR